MINTEKIMTRCVAERVTVEGQPQNSGGLLVLTSTAACQGHGTAAVQTGALETPGVLQASSHSWPKTALAALLGEGG